MTLRLNVPMKAADKSVRVTHVLVWAGWFMTSVHFGLSSTSIKKILFPSSSSALAWDLSTRKKWQRRCSIPSSLSFNALLITCMSTVCKVALVLLYFLSAVFFLWWMRCYSVSTRGVFGCGSTTPCCIYVFRYFFYLHFSQSSSASYRFLGFIC